MAKVKAIKNIEKVKEFGRELEKKHKKWSMLYKIMLFSGLRVSDVLKLKVKDFRGNRVEVIEQKKYKVREIKLPEAFKKEMRKYVKEFNLKDDDYIIFSRKKDAQGNIKAVSRIQAYRVIKEVSEALGMEHIGCHSTRKTFGYFEYQETKDIVRLQHILNHSNYKTTMRYIGLDEDMVDESTDRAYERFF